MRQRRWLFFAVTAALLAGAPTLPAAAEAAAESGVLTRLSDHERRLQALERLLSSREQRPQPLQAALLAREGQGGVQGDRLGALERTLSQVREGIERLRGELQALRVQVENQESRARRLSTTVEELRRQPAAPPRAAAGGDGWRLAAIADGKAWLAPAGKASPLVEVKEGEAVPGLGTVTAIARGGDGRWYVQAGDVKLYAGENSQ